MIPALETRIARLLSAHEDVTDIHLAAGQPMRSRRCGTLALVDEVTVDEASLFGLLRRKRRSV